MNALARVRTPCPALSQPPKSRAEPMALCGTSASTSWDGPAALPARAGTTGTSCVAHSCAYGNLIHPSQLGQCAWHHRHHRHRGLCQPHPEPQATALAWEAKMTGTRWLGPHQTVLCFHCSTAPGGAARLALIQWTDTPVRSTGMGTRELHPLELHHPQGEEVGSRDALGEPPWLSVVGVCSMR